MRMNVCVSIGVDGVLFFCRKKKWEGSAQTSMCVVTVTDKIVGIFGEPYFTQPSPIFFSAHWTKHSPLVSSITYFASTNRCDPCVQAGPELSDLADEFEGRISVVGINNESIFGETKPGDVDQLNEFLDDHREGFRYTIYIDNDEGHAKESKFGAHMHGYSWAWTGDSKRGVGKVKGTGRKYIAPDRKSVV